MTYLNKIQIAFASSAAALMIAVSPAMANVATEEVCVHGYGQPSVCTTKTPPELKITGENKPKPGLGDMDPRVMGGALIGASLVLYKFSTRKSLA
jgi:hypothetical protein